MSSVKSLLKSFTLMLFMIFIGGFVLGYVFLATELIDQEYADSGMYDVSPEWQSYDTGVSFINLQYFIGYVMIFLGIAQFAYTASRKESVVYVEG